MTTKHTEGPWWVEGEDANYQAIVRGPHFEIATCWHHSVGSIEKEMRANAKLIAAAPDLLDVARMVDAWGNGLRHLTEHESKMVKAARAALTQVQP